MLMLLMMLMAPSAKAELFCVQNASQLSAALSLSLVTTGADEIRLTNGTYSMPSGFKNDVQSPYISSLTMTGGWSSDCSVQETDPINTVIDGQGSTASDWYLEAIASVTIRNLTFLQTGGLRLRSVTCQPSGQSYRVSNIRMIDTVEPEFSTATLSFDSRCHTTRVENNLIFGSEKDGIVYACWGSSVLRMFNNTVRDVGGFAFLGVVISGDVCSSNAIGNDFLANNVLGLVRLIALNPRAYNNVYSALSVSDGGGLFTGSADNSTVDPDLDPTTYRPNEPGSPAINSGTENVPGGLPAIDIESNSRTIGGIPDRGAYESSVVPPGPFVLTVTSNADSGAGTLRDVLGQANANAGLNLIQFDIPGACPRLITLATPLPDLTEDVIINGFSQPDSAWNTFDFGNNASLCIGVVGSQLVDVPYALRVPSNSSATLKVRGIGFGRFDDGGGLSGEAAIYLQGGSGHEIQGNQFGGPFHLTTLAGNSEGIRLMNNATSALIGGSSPGHRNTISGSSFAGVHVIGSASGGHQIVNNYIGTNPGGVSAVSNFDGIRLVQSADNDVLDNLISGNTRDGVVIVGEQATSNLVAGNRIGGRRGGLYLCGVPPLPACPPTMTNRKGVLIDSDASDNTIGAGGLQGAPNTIRHSTQHGIRVLSGQRNRLLSNSLYANGSVASEHEIDLGSFGIDAIDADCGAVADGRANRGQNRPVLESALGGASDQSVVFAGELSSCTHDGGFSSVYRIQLFASDACDGNGAGPGQYFLGDVNVVMAGPVQTDAVVAFTGGLEHPWLDLGGKYITATATDLSGNTSEFSQCVQVEASDALFQDRFEQ